MSEAAKVVFDSVMAFLVLIVLSPVFLIVAVLIKRETPGPVFYRGVRVGRYGKAFRIWKFRSMVLDAESLGGPSTSADDPRLTKVGDTIRRLKIDEFPQVINIIAQHMSFVGPRPEVLQEVEKYTEEERQLLTVRPGMVDYATLKFHNEEEILRGAADPHQVYLEKIRPEKMRLGLEYVRNRSFFGDLKILFQFTTTLIKTRVSQEEGG